MSLSATSWIGTAVGAAVSAVPLCWTLLVFSRYRRQWLPLDVILVALLWQSVVQQAAALFYSLLALLGPIQWCSAAAWLLVSGHTLQAGTLATMVVTRLLRIRLAPTTYVTTVTRTHLIYHIISLTLLSACVGITAVLAREDADAVSECTFLPHELDPRYSILSIALHSTFLVASVLVAVISCCLRKPKESRSSKQAIAFTDDTPSSTVARQICFGKHRRRHAKNQALFTSSSDLSSALSDFSSISTSVLGATRNTTSLGPVTKTFWNYCNANTVSGNNPRSNNSTLVKDERDAISPSITFLNGLPPNYPPDLNGDSNTIQKVLNGAYSAESTLGRAAAALHSPLSALRALDNFHSPGSHFLKEHHYRELCSGDYSDSTLNRDYGLRPNWNSDNSYMSTTTSPTSTNSRAPCLNRQPIRPPPFTVPEEHLELEPEELRLPTALGVLALCYCCNHIPILVASGASVVSPGSVPSSWPLHGLALWGGELQACLLPVVLAIFDDRFAPWVARLYARATPSSRRSAHQSRPPLPRGAKFRPYDLEGVSQALRQQQPHNHPQQQFAVQQHTSPVQQLQSPEHLSAIEQQSEHIQQSSQQQQQQQGLQQPKFPITNGSLFTSLDGHIPIVHNYRRRRDMQMGTTYVPVHSNQPIIVHNGFSARSAVSDDLPSSPPTHHHHHPPHHKSPSSPKIAGHHSSSHQGSQDGIDNQRSNLQSAGSVEQLGSKSGLSAEDSVGLRRRFVIEDSHILRRNPLADQMLEKRVAEQSLDETGDDEDDDEDDDEEPIYATLSSGCSVTTAANDDFEFYQHLSSSERPPAHGYHKLTKKPRGPDFDTKPPPPPPLPHPPLPSSVLESRLLLPCNSINIPGYKKRQGFHELELARQSGKPMTTADLLEFYNSSNTESKESSLSQQDTMSNIDDVQVSCENVNGHSPEVVKRPYIQPGPHTDYFNNRMHLRNELQKYKLDKSQSGLGRSTEILSESYETVKDAIRYNPPLSNHIVSNRATVGSKNAVNQSNKIQHQVKPSTPGRTMDSDDDGRGIYSYHDVIRGCQLEDIGQPQSPHIGHNSHPQHYSHHNRSADALYMGGRRRHLDSRRPPAHPNGELADGVAVSRRKMSSSSNASLGVNGDEDALRYAYQPPPHHNVPQYHHHHHHQSASQSSMSSMMSASGSRDPLLASVTSMDSFNMGVQETDDGYRAPPPARHRGYQRQAPPNRGTHATPPSRRRVACRQKNKMVARVLSLDSLHLALQDAATVSYLDTGDVCSHHVSQPDLHRVFVSDFI